MKSKKSSSKKEKASEIITEEDESLQKVDIGLDISTSCIGLCVLEHNTGKLVSLIKNSPPLIVFFIFMSI